MTLDPFRSDLATFWAAPHGVFGWAVYQGGDDSSHQVSGPFLRKITALRVADDLNRVQADAWQVAVLAAQQPRGAGGRFAPKVA